MPYVAEPRTLPPLLRVGVAIAERATGRRLLPARLLARAPRLGVGLGAMEALVEHRRPSPRLLRLVRLTASLTVGCSFCLDLNAHHREDDAVTDAELRALQWLGSQPAPVPDAGLAAHAPSLTASERLAATFAHRLSLTPARGSQELASALEDALGADAVVRLAATIGQVNLWARFGVGLGVPPAGFSDACALLGRTEP